jgi:hypothetical protein
MLDSQIGKCVLKSLNTKPMKANDTSFFYLTSPSKVGGLRSCAVKNIHCIIGKRSPNAQRPHEGQSAESGERETFTPLSYCMCFLKITFYPSVNSGSNDSSILTLMSTLPENWQSIQPIYHRSQ